MVGTHPDQNASQILANCLRSSVRDVRKVLFIDLSKHQLERQCFGRQIERRSSSILSNQVSWFGASVFTSAS